MARKPNKKRSDSAPDVETLSRKPGMETSHAHIATMMVMEGKGEQAESMVHSLFPRLQKRVLARPKRREAASELPS